MNPPVRFLVGTRLYLRSIEEADLPACQRWINDPEIRPFLLTFRPIDAKAEREWWEGHDRSPQPASLHFAIVLDEGDRLIGTTGFVRIDWRNRCASTGSLIGEKDCWGQGYGTEAKNLLLEYAFDTLGLHRVESETFAFNERSARHLLRTGFREEGRSREAFFCRGRFHDSIRYGLLDHEWRALQAERAEAAPP